MEINLSKIIVVDYDPSWPVIFKKFKEVYTNALPGLNVDIQHVGSTSVPGLAAKPVIDIDLIVEDYHTVAEVIKRMNTLGYNHIGDLDLKGREALKTRSNQVPFTNENKIWPRHNLYCGKRNNLHIRNHLAVRNHLRKNPEIAREYGNLKKSLAKKFPYDIDKYIEFKTPLIVKVLEASEFTPKEIKEIVHLNE